MNRKVSKMVTVERREMFQVYVCDHVVSTHTTHQEADQAAAMWRKDFSEYFDIKTESISPPPVTEITKEELLTTVMAAKLLKVKKSTLQNWRCLGKGPPFVRVGSLILYRPSDIEAYINGHVFHSTSD